MTVFTICNAVLEKKVVIYYKIFDKHRYSSSNGSFYAFCVNLLKKKDPKVITQKSRYPCTYVVWYELLDVVYPYEGSDLKVK